MDFADATFARCDRDDVAHVLKRLEIALHTVSNDLRRKLQADIVNAGFRTYGRCNMLAIVIESDFSPENRVRYRAVTAPSLLCLVEDPPHIGDCPADAR